MTDLERQKQFRPQNTVKKVGDYTISYEVLTEKPFVKARPYKVAGISIYDKFGKLFGMAYWSELSNKSIVEVAEGKIKFLEQGRPA